MKSPSLLLFLMLFLALPLKAQITGTITDDETGEGVPFASVIYKGHGVAVASDINGRYKIARHSGWTITFSAVGYVTKTVMIDSKVGGTLNIRLKQDNRTLKEVTVKTKRGCYSRENNPAVELMKKVIEKKKQTDLDNRDY